jgi:hypothetical protein
MELPWNICPYCGTPEPGMRREGITMDDVVRELPKEPMESKENKEDKEEEDSIQETSSLEE